MNNDTLTEAFCRRWDTLVSSFRGRLMRLDEEHRLSPQVASLALTDVMSDWDSPTTSAGMWLDQLQRREPMLARQIVSEIKATTLPMTAVSTPSQHRDHGRGVSPRDTQLPALLLCAAAAGIGGILAYGIDSLVTLPAWCCWGLAALIPVLMVAIVHGVITLGSKASTPGVIELYTESLALTRAKIVDLLGGR